MDREDALLAVAIASLVLQAYEIWRDRKRERRGRHRKR